MNTGIGCYGLVAMDWLLWIGCYGLVAMDWYLVFVIFKLGPLEL
jgi:hypothetical protein